MHKFCIYSWFGFDMPMEERFRLIKRAGFDSVSIWFEDEYSDIDVTREKNPDIARGNGLNIENVHLSFINADEIWTDSLAAEAVIKDYMCGIEKCADYDIPVAVLHLTLENSPPSPTKKGLDRIKRLTELAEKKAVNIALENLRKPEFLDFVFSNIQSDRLGFCYDSGHENCYTKGIDLLAKYGSKLKAIHLHDNDGIADRHWIPGEGNINWNLINQKLNSIGYAGAIALEVTNEFSQHCVKETPEEFLKRAYKTSETIFRDG